MKKVVASLIMVLAMASLAFAGFDSVEGTAPWGRVKVTVDEAAFVHFPLVGWYPDMGYSDGIQFFIFTYVIDKHNISKDHKGCLRASFYTTSNSGRLVRTFALMTDWYEMKAMSMEPYGFMDFSIEEWSHVIVQYTPVCDDTGERFKSTRPAWAK